MFNYVQYSIFIQFILHSFESCYLYSICSTDSVYSIGSIHSTYIELIQFDGFSEWISLGQELNELNFEFLEPMFVGLYLIEIGAPDLDVPMLLDVFMILNVFFLIFSWCFVMLSCVYGDFAFFLTSRHVFAGSPPEIDMQLLGVAWTLTCDFLAMPGISKRHPETPGVVWKFQASPGICM